MKWIHFSTLPEPQRWFRFTWNTRKWDRR